MSELRESTLQEMMANGSDLAEEARILVQRIAEIQHRLGTAKELPADTARVSDLVHRLNNLCTRFRLQKALKNDLRDD